MSPVQRVFHEQGPLPLVTKWNPAVLRALTTQLYVCVAADILKVKYEYG